MFLSSFLQKKPANAKEKRHIIREKNLYILALAQISRKENVHPKAESSSIIQKIVHGKVVSLQWL